MADNDMLHTAEIMKAALPYIDPRTRVIAELFVKIFDLMGSMKSIQSFNSLAACGFEVSKIDIEGLLNGIRPICGIKERTIIDRILNFLNMKKMFEMYNNMMKTMETMKDFGGFPFGDFGSGVDTDTVTGNFAGSNFESIFNSFKNSSFSGTSPKTNYNPFEETVNREEGTAEAYDTKVPNTGNSGSSLSSILSSILESSSTNNSSSNSGSSSGSYSDNNLGSSSDSNLGSSSGSSLGSSTGSTSGSNSSSNSGNSSDSNSSSNSGNNSVSNSRGNSGSSPNDKMFDMLKTMIPPDKISAFENLSMLLNSKSYDNNSKPDNKERNDG